MPYGLSKDIVDRIINVLSKFSEVEEVVLYGSRAKGNFRPGSDIDLTVKGHGLDLKRLNKIRLDLDDLLLPYTFDISLFRQIKNQDLIDHIERVGIVFYRQGSALQENKSTNENR
ncbi:nucleotidyltransferase [Desulfosarcina variabilis str. Montpellier]|uniref:nucleotidyltransferase domain-containing protein n=1 Tax=Desulfosarcina variabilis TaxID=2300 RepID=UPI003AFAC28E